MKAIAALLLLSACMVGICLSASPKFAPYYDTFLDGRKNLTEVWQRSGQKNFHLAFALGGIGGCSPTWGGKYELDDPIVIDQIKEIQRQGGDLIVATGGALGPYLEHLCGSVDDLTNAYLKVLDIVGTTHLDVDVEAPINFEIMNPALARVQQLRPSTSVAFTLMVLAEDYGLTLDLGVNLLINAKQKGLRVDIVNAMTMEFGGPSPDYGDSVIGAAISVLRQMKEVWPEKSDAELKGMLGVTPMIGRNFNGKVFELAHARKLVDWANSNRIGLLAFWSSGRDNGDCPGGGISPHCSSISQQEYEFTRIFQGFN